MKKALLLTGLALSLSLPSQAEALTQAQVTEAGWYTIKCTSGQSDIVNKTLVNADVSRNQNGKNSYSLRVLNELDANRPAQTFIYIKPQNNSWAYRSSNGHWVGHNGCDNLNANPNNMATAGKPAKIGIWAQYPENGVVFIGGASSASNSFEITKADVSAYDIWNVSITININVTPPCNLPYVDFKGENNKGCYRAYNNGVYFVTKGTTINESDLTIPQLSTAVIDNEAKTITVTESRAGTITRYVTNSAPSLGISGDAITAKANELISSVESIESDTEAIAQVVSILNKELYNATIKTLEGHHPYFCKDNVHNNTGRRTPAVRLSDNIGSNVVDLSTGQTDTAGGPIFVDLFNAETKFTTKAGATVTLSPQNAAGNWIHKKLFVDWNHDSQFNYADPDDVNRGWFAGDRSLKHGTDIELVAFDSNHFYPSNGQAGGWLDVNGNNAESNQNMSTPLTFTIPTNATPGDYYGRYMVIWDTNDPAGNPDCTIDGTGTVNTSSNNMKAIGGITIDFKFTIEADTDEAMHTYAEQYANDWIVKLNRLEMFQGETIEATTLTSGIDYTAVTSETGIAAAIDMIVSDLIGERLDGHFVTIQNERTGWYLHSNCGKVTMKNEKYARSLWRIFTAKDDDLPFTFYIRSVYNTGWMQYNSRNDAVKRYYITPDEADRTPITLRPFGPGAERFHFAIAGPHSSNQSYLAQNAVQHGQEYDPYNETMVTGQNDDGATWIINYVNDDEVKERHLEKYLSRFADSVDDTKSLNKIRPTEEIIAARTALQNSENFSVDALIELLKLPDNGLNQPKPGRYYRLAMSEVNKLQNGITSGDYYLSTETATVSNKNAVKALPKEGNEAKTIFYLTKEGNDHKLIAYNGFYVKGGANEFFHVTTSTAGNTNAPKVETPRAGTRGVNPISSLEKNAYNIVLAGTRYCHLATTTNAFGMYETGNIVTNACSDACGADHNFYIEEVTELPVEIHSGDNCGTVYLPVAVTVPASYKVYIASHETTKTKPDGTPETINRLKLTEAANGIIPAYTPAVIYGNPGICRVAIDYTAEVVAPTEDTDMTVAGNIKATEARENDNLFIKSTASAPATNAIAMALTDAEGETFKGETASFVRLTSGVVPANTMTFVGTATTPDDVDVPLNTTDGADKPFSLDLETGKATNGITSIAVSKADGTTVIYDLQGRRLNKATKGINIINGRKVLVK